MRENVFHNNREEYIMKGASSRILLKPQTKGTQKAVVKRAIAEAVAIEREAMKQQKTEKNAEELMASDLEREEDDNMAEKKVVRKTVEKKEPVKKVVKAAVKEVEETVVKEAEAPVAKVAAVKEAEAPVVKVAAVKEDSVKAAPAKEKAPAAKKTAVNEEIYVQFGNNEVLTKDIVEKVKKAYVAEGHKADSIQDVRVYVKPEENMVYYVVNNDYASGISLF